jgi:putative membrane protein
VPIATLTTGMLLLTAVTGTSIPLILAGAFGAWNRARELLPHDTIEWAEGEVLHRGSATAFILTALLFLAVLVAVAISSLRLAGFRLERDRDVLRTRRGLLTEHSGTVVVDRVQAVRLVQGVWRRLLGYAAVEVEVAGVSANDAERMLFPLVRMADAVELIRRAVPELGWEGAALQAAPRRARRRYYTVPIVWALAITAAALVLPGWGRWLTVLPLPMALLVGHARAAAAGWHSDNATVILRWHRVFARHTLIARRQRVQFTRVSQSWWQRRADLAGFHIELSTKRAGHVAHIEFVDADRLQRTTGRRSAGRNRAPRDTTSSALTI